MEQIRKTIRLVSPVTGLKILTAIEKISVESVVLTIKRKTILEDGKQAFTIGFEKRPADEVLWLVIGHGPVADRNLFLDKPYAGLFLRTEKNLEYRPSDEIFEQRFGIAQESILSLIEKLVEKLEELLNEDV